MVFGRGREAGEEAQVLDEVCAELKKQGGWSYSWKLNICSSFSELRSDKDKAARVARYIFVHRERLLLRGKGSSHDQPALFLFKGLMQGSLPIAPEELLDWLEILHNPGEDKLKFALHAWPVAFMIQSIERRAKKAPLSKDVVSRLKAMLDWPELDVEPYYGSDLRKVAKRIRTIIGEAEGADLSVTPYKKLSGDNFGAALEPKLKSLTDEEASKWHRCFNLAADAAASKPTAKFAKSAKELREEVGKEWLRRHLHQWVEQALSAKLMETTHTYTSGQHEHTYVEASLFTKPNVTLLKGLVWIADGFQDARTINLVADLCEKCMQKIPGVGPAAQATANACLWYLEVTPGAQAAARLSRLGTAIKQKSVQKKVAALVAKKAEAAGITTIQLEERVVPDFGLVNGEKTVAFDEYALRIAVTGPGQVLQTWHKPDGAPQKSKPKIVGEKAALKTKLTKVRDEVKALKKILVAQRDRIDRLFVEDVTWALSEVQDYYVQHPLVSSIAKRLIWSLTTDGATTAALWVEGSWQDVRGSAVGTTEATQARLWHPVEETTDDVMAWRARLAELAVMQPTKQAFREVYLLTDAERNTRTYSNRMAAHMLKQHQMATLMASRGWAYALMGGYDASIDNQWASKPFVTSDLTAEYLIHKNWDDNFNDAGIFLYVGTDQLRFTRMGVQVPLDQIPPRLLSETLREADLFVGVASVGNDPAWVDQGATPEARNYWHSYSFGKLDGFAETRKQVLEALIPRLKIRDVAHIEGKFLIVDGKLNTYKIHLGSSNILMAPGDRYLCIVPGAVSKSSNVALPFEGDNRLSVILSKALMLADDDKITASDIVSQLAR